MKLRNIVLGMVAVLVIGITNVLIVQKETLIANGQSIFLELAPRDPRSLVQGDYMVLSYALSRDANLSSPVDGYVVVKLDAQNVAHFQRRHSEERPLTTGEMLLRYHIRNRTLYFGAESFFFQEGQADLYARARYAELKMEQNGESVLIGLRDLNFKPLGLMFGETQ